MEYFLFSPSFLVLLGSRCMHYVYFGVPLLVFLFNLHLLIKKKKKKLSVPCKVTLGLQKIFHSTLSK